MALSKEKINSEIDYFDRIKINSNQTVQSLKKTLPLDGIQFLSRKCQLSNIKGRVRNFGFKSKIDIIAPQKEAIEILSHYACFLGQYKISYIEITRDQITDSKNEAIEKVEFSLKFMKKKYTHEFLDFKSTGDNLKNHANKAYADEDIEEKFSDRTGYWLAKKVKYVVYPRISKVTKKPCFHEEWRLLGAHNIKNRTGMVDVKDILNFDIKKFIQEQNKKYLELMEINYRNLGRWIQGYPQRRNPIIFFGPKKSIIYDRTFRAGHSFCRYLNYTEGISTVAGLWNYFKKEKKRLKKKKGRKTPWENKLLGLTDYKLNTFMKVL
tara:strand:- start:1119 stop:2087 length:969 start_codon:yes stop_codon:yes gene_type:complete